MANSFLTSEFKFNAANAAAMILSSNMVASNLVSHEIEAQIKGVPSVGPSGGSVKVKVIGADVANEQDHRQGTSALTTTDANETEVNVDCLNYFYVKKKLDTLEGTWQLDDFVKKMIIPATIGLAEKIDQFMIRKIAGGFARNVTGTAGTAASTATHIINARKTLQDAKVPGFPRVGLIGTTVEASFLGLKEFVNKDYGSVNDSNLAAALLSNKYGINWFVDQNVGTFNYGDTAGSVLANGAVTTGALTANFDAFTAATGTVYEGTRFKVAGDTTEYVTTRDAFIASNAVDLPFYPAVVTGWSDNAAVTFQTAHTSDTIFHPGMVAGAVVAPRPLMNNSDIATFGGLSVRLTFESTITDGTSGAADFMLLDVYAGGKVIRPEGGTIMQG